MMTNFKFTGKDYLKVLLIIVGSLIGLSLFISCSSNNRDNEELASVETEEAIEVEASGELHDNSEGLIANLPNSLKSCTAYSETFIHPFTGEKMMREVVGMTGEGLCEYREEMPNGGEMRCTYSEETRTVMARYYGDMMRIGPGSFSSGANTYTIEGKSVANPLDEVMNNGTCSITGYE